MLHVGITLPGQVWATITPGNVTHLRPTDVIHAVTNGGLASSSPHCTASGVYIDALVERSILLSGCALLSNETYNAFVYTTSSAHGIGTLSNAFRVPGYQHHFVNEPYMLNVPTPDGVTVQFTVTQNGWAWGAIVNTSVAMDYKHGDDVKGSF